MQLNKIATLTVLFVFVLYFSVQAQPAESDTVRISFEEFRSIALDHSREMQARKQQVRIAESRRSETEASRYLPNLTLTTAHGLIPGVRSKDDSFSQSALYLDPTLRNDWNDWAVFNQFEINVLQPIYTWGALSNAIKASRAAVDIAAFEYDGEESRFELQLFQLYQGMLLAKELQRLAIDSKPTIRMADRELQKLIDEGSDEIDDADLYQFEIFMYEFESQLDEVNENVAFLIRAWQIALGVQGSGIVYLPSETFLDPVEDEILELDFYLSQAYVLRPEARQLRSVRETAEYGRNAVRAQNYPAIFLGANYRYAYASNRPRQFNPFISNPANTSSLTVGIGLRQNLNFFILQSRTERAEAQLRQAGFAKDAVMDGIALEISDRYKDARVARSRLLNNSRALDISRQWLRQEQLDYDIGFGDVTNLVDAFRSSIELEADQKQRTYDLNMRMARLLNASGIPVTQLYNSGLTTNE
ncbi:MAG: TolC family protein [Balneolales bacterium]|nr:TolC family protein [Balneolales bacterium]